jgi:hypothetical protein
LPRFACSVPLLVVSRMLCNLSLRAWILAFHRRTMSIDDRARLACLLAMGCTLWIPLSGRS